MTRASMTRRACWSLAGVLLATSGSCAGPTPADDAPAALPLSFANAGIAASPLSACLVLSPANPTSQAELTQIQNIILEWTYDSALVINWATAALAPVVVNGITYQTTCGFTTDASGVATFQEDFRAYIDDGVNYPPRATPYPDALTVPGCTADEPIGSQAYKKDASGTLVKEKDGSGNYLAKNYLWGGFPSQRAAAGPKCLYNAHLFPGQPHNNYLHESGHSLGFRHEMDRADATCGPGGPDDGNYMTEYDINSVMHYVRTMADNGCVAPGNWGAGGLSPLDYFGSQMLFPRRLSAIPWGALGFVDGGSTSLISEWQDRGAHVDTANPSKSSMRDFRWTVDGRDVSATSSAAISGLSPGVHPLHFEFNDMWGRHHSDDFTVEVLTATDAASRVVSSAAISALLM